MDSQAATDSADLESSTQGPDKGGGKEDSAGGESNSLVNHHEKEKKQLENNVNEVEHCAMVNDTVEVMKEICKDGECEGEKELNDKGLEKTPSKSNNTSEMNNGKAQEGKNVRQEAKSLDVSKSDKEKGVLESEVINPLSVPSASSVDKGKVTEKVVNELETSMDKEKVTEEASKVKSKSSMEQEKVPDESSRVNESKSSTDEGRMREDSSKVSDLGSSKGEEIILESTTKASESRSSTENVAAKEKKDSNQAAVSDACEPMEVSESGDGEPSSGHHASDEENSGESSKRNCRGENAVADDKGRNKNNNDDDFDGETECVMLDESEDKKGRTEGKNSEEKMDVDDDSECNPLQLDERMDEEKDLDNSEKVDDEMEKEDLAVIEDNDGDKSDEQEKVVEMNAEGREKSLIEELKDKLESKKKKEEQSKVGNSEKEKMEDNVEEVDLDNVDDAGQKDDMEKNGSKEKDDTEKKNDKEKKDKEDKGRKEDMEEDDIVELPVDKKPMEVVDLEEDDDDGQKNSTEKVNEGEAGGDSNNTIKLRSLASLVGARGGEEAVPVVPVTPKLGSLVEHGTIIGSDEMQGLGLQISNVVGGEDCITGLTVDEDRDTFPSIQISSVTTLMEPMSPEDPNLMGKENQEEKKDGVGESGIDDSQDSQEATGIKIVNSESLVSKDKGSDGGGLGSIQVASVVSEAGKEGTVDSFTPRYVYHILRSIITVRKECVVCSNNVRCAFRITKKGDTGTLAFLCTAECKAKWIASLPNTDIVEKPRLIFEKLCGMCAKDIASTSRSGQFSWETREFCSKLCLTFHLNEVAGTCHTCHEVVRSVYIGKYCVRFGSDVHQFCSNQCLETYKNKIKVCCYCQKNLSQVEKVSAVSSKEYCGMKCLKRAARADIGQQNYQEKHPCLVCQNFGVNRYEFLTGDERQKLCSDPCLNVYKYANKVKAVCCCLCFRVLNAEDVSHYLYHGGHQLRVFCSDSCINVFILSARKIVICDNCKVKKYNFDMIHQQLDEEFKEYFYCSLSCLNSKEVVVRVRTMREGDGNSSSTTTTTTTSTTTDVTTSTDTTGEMGSVSTSTNSEIVACSWCTVKAKPQYHMVMSDNTLRSFCQYNCAFRFKETNGFQVKSSPSSSTTTQTTQTTHDSPPSTSLEPGNVTKNKKNGMTTKEAQVDRATVDAAAEILKLLTPPTMSNKMTSCRPSMLSKGVFCRPHPWHRSTQTDPQVSPMVPVPVPIYVPTPMMMYNSPFPVPLCIPVPIPVPVFIPTSAKTAQEVPKLMKKIQDEIPSDPYEAEMLMLARATCEDREQQQQEQQAEAEVVEDSPVVQPVGEVEAAEAAEAVQNSSFALLDELDCSSNDSQGNQGKKRKAAGNQGGRRQVAKRTRRSNSNDSASLSDPDDPDMEVMGEAEAEVDNSLLEGQEYHGPYLNKMYGLAAWKSWVSGKNAELAGVSSSRTIKLISEDLLAMNCDELNYALCLFLKDLRKPSGENYQPDTVFYILLGIQQHLFDSARTDCIFMDFGFEKFTNSFDEITKTFMVEPPVPSPTGTSVGGATRITETMLWECRQLGAHTPQVLLNTLFYFNTKVFKLQTVEEHLSLSFQQIVKQWRRTAVGVEGSVTRTTLLRYYPKKVAGDNTPRKIHEMYENRDDPLRCPVKLYEFYQSKCPEGVRSQKDLYYMYPERSCVPDSPTWFSTQTVTASSLAKMLHRVLMVREVQEALAQ